MSDQSKSMQSEVSLKDFMPVTDETAKAWGFTDRQTVLRLHREAGLPLVRIGERVWLNYQSVGRWLLERETCGKSHG